MTPPDPPPLTIPIGREADAYAYLEHHGIVATIPTIRSSDWEGCSNPFQYYLSRRLGLVPALSWSSALNRGSFFHIPYSLYDNPEKWNIYNSAIKARLTELKEVCDGLGIKGEKKQAVLDREVQDAAYARAWYTAMEKLPVPRKDGKKEISIVDHMSQSRFRKIGSELLVSVTHEDLATTPLVIQIDVLLLDTKTNKLWIRDAKTCSCTPLHRLNTVRNEFQTQHYMVCTHMLLEQGALQSMFDLPKDVTLGGMIHDCVQKPSIIFGQKDRPYHWTSYGKGKCTEGSIVKDPGEHGQWMATWDVIPNDKGKGSKGDFTGTFEECMAALHKATGKKPEKEYHGEPSLHLYTNRCFEWYKEQVEANRDAPPVNMTTTTSAVLRNPSWLTLYQRRLHWINKWAIMPPAPGNFPMFMQGASSISGEPTAYADFYNNDPKDWPEIARQNGFIVSRRDEDLERAISSVNFQKENM